MHPHSQFSAARQFQSDVTATTAAIRREFESFERRAISKQFDNASGLVERAFIFEKLAELRVLVDALGEHFQAHADLVEQSTLPLPNGARPLRRA